MKIARLLLLFMMITSFACTNPLETIREQRVEVIYTPCKVDKPASVVVLRSEMRRNRFASERTELIEKPEIIAALPVSVPCP